MADLTIGNVGGGGQAPPPAVGSTGTLALTGGSGEAPAAAPTSGQVKAAVADANQSLAENGTQLTFVFDDQLHEPLVKIVDTQTHEVVQQIPSEAMLAAARALSGSPANGALVNTKV